MKIGLIQFNPKIGSTQESLSKKIIEAKAQGAECIVLPELATTGYPPRDLLFSSAFIERNLKVLEEVQSLSQNTVIVCGFVQNNTTGKGRPFFNALAVFENREKILEYHKRLLPTYDVFEEDRYFEPGKMAQAFRLKGKQVAVGICEDFWADEEFGERTYHVAPLKDIEALSPELVINISASPFRLHKPQMREQLFGRIADQLKVPMIFCNQIGGNDELVFDGCSFIVGPGQKWLTRLPAFKEEVRTVTFPEVGHQDLWPTEDAQWLAGALELGLKDYVFKCGGKKVVLGLSGGIDSAVVAALAVRALGANQVTGFSLPTQFTSKESIEDAREIAKRLGIQFSEISIESLYKHFVELFEEKLKLPLKELALENIQPRLRMTILMAFANHEGGMLLNTSNKSEIATGYSTLYGDSSGALSVIGDLTKTQVYSLAQYLNKKEELIPKRVISKAPSAELRHNQTDQDTLPSYEQLDRVLTAYIEENKSVSELLTEGHNKVVVDSFLKLYQKSEFKRRQLPPVIRVSKRAFDWGRRIPVAACLL